jgi:hypothetical protein
MLIFFSGAVIGMTVMHRRAMRDIYYPPDPYRDDDGDY